MPIGVYFSPPSLDEATYNSILKELEGNGEWPPPGMLHHSCFTEGPKLAVYEIWDSEDAMQSFGETRLFPVMKEVGFDPGEPAVVSIINVVQA